MSGSYLLRGSFPRRKFGVALGIMSFGMFVAIVWAVWQHQAGRTYPYDTFLFNPKARFSDFSDAFFIANLPNPYDNPDAFYLPFTWLTLRLASPQPIAWLLAGTLFSTIACFIIVLFLALRKVLAGRSTRLALAVLFVAVSYPVAFCVDRGNIELVVASLVTISLYLMHRARYASAALFLLPAICWKLYPALFLVLLLRQKKMRLVLLTLAALAGITAGSVAALSLSFPSAWRGYTGNMHYLSQVSAYENHTLEGGASLFNAYKTTLLFAAHERMIEPVDFSFDAPFIQTSYTIYTALMLALLAVVLAHVLVVEKCFQRCAMMLLLYLSICTPNGGDYRLLYACMALILLVLLQDQRFWDWTILVLLAFTLIPKKEILFPFAGLTESGFADVSIQVVLNPLCVFAAIALMLRDGWKHHDGTWTRMRLDRLMRIALQR